MVNIKSNLPSRKYGPYAIQQRDAKSCEGRDYLYSEESFVSSPKF